MISQTELLFWDLLPKQVIQCIRPMKDQPLYKGMMTQGEYILYGTYDPLTITITHILNNKSGIGWTSYSNTGVPVPVFAIGSGAAEFVGHYHQEQIFHKPAALTGVE